LELNRVPTPTKEGPTGRHSVLAELEGDFADLGLTALSPNGQHFAATNKTPNQEDTTVIVWDTQTGQQKFQVPGDPEHYADLIMLSNERLFVSGRLSEEMAVWDLATGTQQRTWELPERGIKNEDAGLSSDGKYLATAADDRFVVLHAHSGKVAAVMGAPKATDRSGNTVPKGGTRNRAASTDAVFVYAWLQSVRFSPDGQELAAVSTEPHTRLICWNSRGKLMYDEPFFSARPGVLGEYAAVVPESYCLARRTRCRGSRIESDRVVHQGAFCAGPAYPRV